LISDPWAEALAGPEGEALAQRVDQIMAHRELWVATRTAVIDEQVLARTRAPTPVRQVVLLGAGLDTRAARLATPGVRFFEVDHPASQGDKLERVRRIPGYPVAGVAYVACDFERDDFIARLLHAGFRDDAPALIIWEGVTPYLLEPAIRGTLRRIATRCDPGTVLIFDHFMKRLVESPSLPAKDEKTRAFVDALGERFVFGTNDPLPMLYEEGFRHVRSVSFDEACLSLTGTYAREREFRFQRIVLASCTPAGSL
jgi:methyltransferase (TIGR00027 family)